MIRDPSINYRYDIDGMRAISVLAVVLYHAFPNALSGGFIGVDIFFVISGYLISLIIFNDLNNNNFSIIDFYIKRIKRIFPSLILILIIVYSLGWLMFLPDEFSKLGLHIFSSSLFLSNLLNWKESGYFDVSSLLKPLIHLWSLSVEEQFYLFWPLILLFFYSKKFNILSLIVFLIFITYTINIHLIKEYKIITFYAPFTRFWEFLSGALIAWINVSLITMGGINFKINHLLNKIYYVNSTENKNTFINTLSFIGLLLLMYGFLRIDKSLNYPGEWALVPVLGSVLIIISGSNAFVNKYFLSSKLLVWFGKISYPFYLWHWPLISFATIINEERPSKYIMIFIIFLSIIISWLTYRFIEYPIRNCNPKHNSKITILLLFILLTMGYIGYNSFVRDGLTFRNAAKQLADINSNLKTPNETRFSDGSCLKLLNFNIELVEPDIVCLTNSKFPTILIVGDSHALALNSSAHLNKINLETVALAAHGCVPTYKSYKLMLNNTKELINCKLLSENIIKILQKIPSITTILINTRGPYYFTGKGFGAEEDSVYSFKSVMPLNISQENMFKGNYAEIIDVLIKFDKKIIFVNQVPELGFHPSRCVVTRPFSLNEKIFKECSLSLDEMEKRQKKYKEIIKTLNDQYVNLIIFDPINIFCDYLYCYGLRNNNILYFDDDHPSIAGSLMMLEYIKYNLL